MTWYSFHRRDFISVDLRRQTGLFFFQPSPAKLLQYLFVLYFYVGSSLSPVRSSSTLRTVIFIFYFSGITDTFVWALAVE